MGSVPELRFPIADTDFYIPIQYTDAVSEYRGVVKVSAVDEQYGPVLIGTILGAFFFGIVTVSDIMISSTCSNTQLTTDLGMDTLLSGRTY